MERKVVKTSPFRNANEALAVSELTDMANEEQQENPHFIESNTSGITLAELEEDCIVPTFKDMESTIAHQNFAKVVLAAAQSFYGDEQMGEIECRVSHVINGRTPDALHLNADELTEEQKTKFYQRFAFCFEVLTKSDMIDGQPVHLTIGGQRRGNSEKI